VSVDVGDRYPIALDRLPSHWRTGYVGDFALRIEPGFASGKHNFDGDGIPHLRPMNVDRNGRIDLEVTKFVAPDSDARRLQAGDVLFNNTNSPELVGKTAPVMIDGRYAFSNHMTRLRFRDDIDPKYAAYQLHFLWMKGYFKYRCVKHVNQASISSGTLATTVPFVSAPTPEQRLIVAEIDKQFSRLDEAVTNLQRVKRRLAIYKQTLLEAAISGQLSHGWRERTVHTDPIGEDPERSLIEKRRCAWPPGLKYKEPTPPDPTLRLTVPSTWAKVSWEAILSTEEGAFKRGPFGSALRNR
jgi:type I restriction enzyme S subunit